MAIILGSAVAVPIAEVKAILVGTIVTSVVMVSLPKVVPKAWPVTTLVTSPK